MATYKLEVKKEFGQLHHRLFDSGSAEAKFDGPIKDLKGLLDAVASSLDNASVSKTDTVIFRQIGYSNRKELHEAVRTATY